MIPIWIHVPGEAWRLNEGCLLPADKCRPHWEVLRVEEIILTREQYKQLDNPFNYTSALPSDYHPTAGSWGSAAVRRVFFYNLPPPPQQPHWYAPLVACFVWQRSAVVQAGDNWHGCFLGKAMTSCVSRTIMTQYGNLSGCGEIMCWTDTHPFMVIHLRTSRYPAFRFFGSFGTFDVYLWAPWKSVKLQRAHSRSRHQNRRVSQLKYMLWGFFFFFKL